MNKEPVFLTDKNHTVVLEALTGVPNAAVPDSCKPFEVLTANTSEGAAEKHLPVVEINGKHITVKVGSIFHPMTEEHSIGWVCLVTKAGCTMRVCLDASCEPVAHFTLEASTMRPKRVSPLVRRSETISSNEADGTPSSTTSGPLIS